MAIATDCDARFERDVRAYLSALPELLKTRQQGRYVLIARADKFDVYDTREAAMNAGNAKFRQTGFIVRLISEEDERLAQEWLDACPS